MSKLPNQKTTIRDMSQFTNIGDGISGLNVATIINAKTGPMERMTLTSFDDLVNYYCTGSAITQKDDITIQCLGALLNTSAVDVIRVGSSKLKVGKTNDGKLIYTDNEYNPINELSRISFNDNSVAENSLAIASDEWIYYVGDKPKGNFDVSFYNNDETHLDCNIKTLVKYVVESVDKNNCNILSYDDTSFYYDSNYSFYDTYLTNVNVSYINTSEKIVALPKKTVEINSAIILNGVSYIFNGLGTLNNSQIFENPKQLINWIDDDTMSSEKFLGLTIAYASPKDMVTYSAVYDLSKLIDYSDNIKEHTNSKSEYYYNKSDKFNSLYLIKGNTFYNYNNHPLPDNFTISERVDEDDDKERVVVSFEDSTGKLIECSYVDITADETDFAKIINIIERDKSAFEELVPCISASIYLNESSVYYSGDDEVYLIDTSVNGIYKCTLKSTEYQLEDDYSVLINGTTYYCGKKPIGKYLDKDSSDLSKIFVPLNGKDPEEDTPKLTYNEFFKLLLDALNANIVLGFVSSNTLLIPGNVTIRRSENIKVMKSLINQTELVSNSKFALIGKFPSALPLFEYSYIRNDDYNEYDIIDVNWSYNQISGTMTIGFDDSCSDNFGNSLYYTKYNEGELENDYFHILQLNDFVKFDKKDTDGIELTTISSFGNELIVREPSETDYADAIKKYLNYEDKHYSFIWDSGHANPILAKAMNVVGLEKNAQFVPSFPVDYTTVEQFISYHNSLGLDTFQGYEIVPAHKGTYCGSFLSKVPASLSYIVARINSYRNGSVEYQPLFGPTRGAVSAPNLVCNLNVTDRQKLSDLGINSIVNNINGTYITNNDTAQKKSSYLSDENIVYMTNTIAHICEEYNPKIIAEDNTPDLWDNIISQLTDLIEQRLKSGKKPAIHDFRVICDNKLNTQDVIESHRVKYKVEAQFNLATKYVTCYTDVVRLNSW